MSPDQIASITLQAHSIFRALPTSARGSLACAAIAYDRLLQVGDVDGAKWLATNTTNPPLSGMTDADFLAFVSSVVSLLPP
jgi:hypothetical protein